METNTLTCQNDKWYPYFWDFAHTNGKNVPSYELVSNPLNSAELTYRGHYWGMLLVDQYQLSLDVYPSEACLYHSPSLPNYFSWLVEASLSGPIPAMRNLQTLYVVQWPHF